MKNIICNNCVGARLYEQNNVKFGNPFMWTAINSEDFVKLINYWNKIDLTDITLSLEQWKPKPYKNVLVTLPFGIKVHFEHYLQDDSVKVPTKRPDSDNEIYCPDAIAYAKEKWFSRLERMTDKPTFLIVDNYITKLADLKKINCFDHQVLLFTGNKRIDNVLDKKIKTIYRPFGRASTGKCAEYLLTNYASLFK